VSAPCRSSQRAAWHDARARLLGLSWATACAQASVPRQAHTHVRAGRGAHRDCTADRSAPGAGQDGVRCARRGSGLPMMNDCLRACAGFVARALRSPGADIMRQARGQMRHVTKERRTIDTRAVATPDDTKHALVYLAPRRSCACLRAMALISASGWPAARRLNAISTGGCAHTHRGSTVTQVLRAHTRRQMQQAGARRSPAARCASPPPAAIRPPGS
jgi:hypothetical protein